MTGTGWSSVQLDLRSGEWELGSYFSTVYLDVQATGLNDEPCALWRTVTDAKINRRGEVVLNCLWPKQAPRGTWWSVTLERSVNGSEPVVQLTSIVIGGWPESEKAFRRPAQKPGSAAPCTQCLPENFGCSYSTTTFPPNPPYHPPSNRRRTHAKLCQGTLLLSSSIFKPVILTSIKMVAAKKHVPIVKKRTSHRIRDVPIHMPTIL